jgi:arylformamidase
MFVLAMIRAATILAVPALACAPSAAVAQTGAPPLTRTGVAYDVDGSVPSPQRLGTLDLYRPAPARRADRRPVVVYVHGGGWAVGDKRAVGAKARLFTRAGYVFASVNYRLSPSPPHPANPTRVRFPDHPRDVAEAVVWLHRHARRFGGDRRRIALIGHSAGAHLVALVATDPSYLGGFGGPRPAIRGFVPLDAGAFNVASEIGNAPPGRRTLFVNAFGTPAEEARDARWAAASMLTHADPGDPPALVVNQRRRAGLAARYAAGLGGAPDARGLLLDKTHAEINRELGAPGDTSPLTPTVLRFVRSVLGPPRR